MAVVVDTNTLSAVFSKENKEHKDFIPVLRWVIKGKAKFVFGGTKYLKELERAERYLNILKELLYLRKAYNVDKVSVDEKQKYLEGLCNDTGFNDAHMIALLIVSQTKVFCTNDNDAFRYVGDSRFYSCAKRRPSIYTNLHHSPKTSLLCENNLTDIDKPYVVLNKKQREALDFFQE